MVELILQSLVHQFCGDIRRGSNGTRCQLIADCSCGLHYAPFTVLRGEATNDHLSVVAVPQRDRALFQLMSPHYLIGLGEGLPLGEVFYQVGIALQKT